MKSAILLSAVLASGAAAAPSSDKSTARIISAPIHGYRSGIALNPRHEALRKRSSDTATVNIGNEFTYYSMNISIGTPGQPINVLLDTGSSDLWVSSSSNPYCAKNQQEVQEGYLDCSFGLFDTSKSSTWQANKTSAGDEVPLFTQYGDYTYAEGYWGTDKVSIGSIDVSDCSLGLATKSNSSNPVLGIGFKELESTNQDSNTPFTYNNLPILLVQQGYIDSSAYSLYLNDLNAQTGNILFGGVDHCAYTGDLVTVPLVKTVPGYDEAIELAIQMTSFAIDGSNGKAEYSADTNYAALLDSGTSFAMLPDELANNVMTALDAQFNDEIGYYITDCDAGSGSSGLTFGFNSITIKVPFSEILIELTDNNNQPVTNTDGSAMCAVGILGLGDSGVAGGSTAEIVLGDTFLRSAYVVYDLENREVSIAQVQYNATCTSVEAISDSVPSATKAANIASLTYTGLDPSNTGNIAAPLVTGAGQTTLSNGTVIYELETSVAASSQPTKTAKSSSGVALSSGAYKSSAIVAAISCIVLFCF